MSRMLIVGELGVWIALGLAHVLVRGRCSPLMPRNMQAWWLVGTYMPL